MAVDGADGLLQWKADDAGWQHTLELPPAVASPMLPSTPSTAGAVTATVKARAPVQPGAQTTAKYRRCWVSTFSAFLLT